ncbi:MAG: putative manganese-dependent inorganic pyrophosphatase [Candidatus Moranbacteria bacterium GW2011_GWC2_37_73]|nr:MAG: putative manganese-dependent inorganic pyrophosphatase [Parcubacteria group bacterium GW2011_GWC1_36_108]KKQ01075.1 MAG: putative manganese-dependent inorganic pyrophosphatase [Candidatus Moranbacteria bacterium GW2011_GWD1_36_198]KKQ02477.1 MAG: putative manganese-dependent inorganic pyrophosphatase [Candidatus Moranbacteria bacterium GW2011_GWD2_36_198]KKQ40135.1 MAG: putative manganese-dependent inorganic pyrophosphatase [Candidatus Moranbacteria bacterium GW2011_GWC2_37_73]HAS00245.
MSKVFIVGHKNPDTDSIVSAIAAQEFFTKVLGKESKACRAGMLNNETKFILERFGVEIPELVVAIMDQDSVALVDHNEAGQTFEGLNYANVDYIFDHHKLAIVTEKPIFCRMEPLGSTSSLIAKMFFESEIEISEISAKLLLAGILSDTLNMMSPTTTQEDRNLAVKLNVVAKLNVEEFVSEMFEAKSSLEGISVQDVITLDYKVFEMGKSKVGIGTWETTNPESVNARKDEIIKALITEKNADKLDHMFFMVVDIIKGSCELYIISETEKVLAEKVFGGTVENEIMFLSGVVSRKKQIVPPLTEELSK